MSEHTPSIPPKLISFLDFLYNLPEEQIYQNNGYVKDEWGESCVAAWAQFHMGKVSKNSPFPFPVYSWKPGSRRIRDLFRDVGYTGRLASLLHKHGAHYHPWGPGAWDRHPYFVLRDALYEVTGFQHLP